MDDYPCNPRINYRAYTKHVEGEIISINAKDVSFSACSAKIAFAISQPIFNADLYNFTCFVNKFIKRTNNKGPIKFTES